MVTGGYDGSNRIDTTEVFQDNVWRTVSGKRTVPTSGLRTATVDNRVFSFGISFNIILNIIVSQLFSGGQYPEGHHQVFQDPGVIIIEEYNPENEEWLRIGSMKNARYEHAVSVVSFEDYADWCE